MKCPNCGQNLWFSRTFCPFCKTAIPSFPVSKIPPSSALNTAVAIAWCIFFGYQLSWIATQDIWVALRAPSLSPTEWGMAFGTVLGGPGLAIIAGLLAWRLYQKPRLSTSTWLIVVCLILLGRFWIGHIVLLMASRYGGHTFLGAIYKWWLMSTSSFGRALPSFGVPVFLLFSIVYWPFYCSRVERPAPPQVPAAESVASR
jgi:hypothetical protein